MTLRRRLRTIVFSTALVTGGLAAVPLATGTAAAKSPVIRNDPLAPIAQRALDSLAEFDATGDQTARGRDDVDRHGIAVVVAERLVVDPVALEDAWRLADAPHQKA